MVLDKIKEICMTILTDYQGVDKHEAWELVTKMPLFYPSACAAILFTHEEFSTERAKELRAYLLYMEHEAKVEKTLDRLSKVY